MMFSVLTLVQNCVSVPLRVTWHTDNVQVLGELCEVIVEPLRDRVVLGLLQAALVQYSHYVASSLRCSCILCITGFF